MSQPESPADDAATAAQPPAAGKRVLEVQPMQVNLSRIVAIGTGLFALAFVGLIAFHGRLDRAGHAHWPWIALVGAGLGLLGLLQLRRMERPRAR